MAKKITVNILNPNNTIELENKEISVQTGIIIGQAEESVPFGNFIIPKPDNEETKGRTSFIGYDYMIKFNIPYKNRVTFPCEAKVLFQDICSQAGVIAGNIDFVNAEYVILGNPFTNNEDCRTVLSNIAQLAGGFAKIGRDNKCYIKTLKSLANLLTVKDINAMTVRELNLTYVKLLAGEKSNADETLDGNNYFDDFSKNKQWGGLNSLVIGLSSIEGENTAIDDEDSIEEYGKTEIVIQDNYFLTSQVEREKVITPIWNKLKGLKYLPFKAKYYGYPYLDCGDLIYIEDTQDKGHISYVFNHTFTFNGAYSGSLETPALTKAQTAYKNTIDMKSRFFRTERSIDKINGKIEDIIEEQTETTSKLTQHEQTIDGITDTISSVESKIEDVENETVIINSKVVQAQLDIDGVNYKFEATGGLNLIRNSTLELGLDVNNNYSGTIEIKKNADIRNNTISKSAIQIDTGYIETDEIKIISDMEYTYSCLIWKNELTNVTVTIITDKEEIYNIECEPNAFQKFSFIFKSAIETVKIKIQADSSYVLIADRMLNMGNSSLGWQLYQGEVITASTKITDDGIEIESSNSKTKWIANSYENKIINKDTSEDVVSFNGDETIMTKARTIERFTVGKLRATVLENEDIIFTFDD